MSIVDPQPRGRVVRPIAASRAAKLSTEEWESRIGEQLRRARISAGLDQSQLADQAGISVGALRNLERGAGSTVKSLVRVTRALGREDWLDTIAPAVSVSPIDVLRSGSQQRTRVYRARAARGAGEAKRP